MMDFGRNSGDEYLQCPYDDTHQILAKSFSNHLQKCRQNHKGFAKLRCKFDSNHLLPKPELSYHYTVCPSRYLIQKDIQLRVSNDEGLTGDVTGPPIVSVHVDDDEEDWGAAPTYHNKALFNKKEPVYEEDDEVYIPPGLNYRHKPSQPKQAKEEQVLREPATSSIAAQLSGGRGVSHQTVAPNMVYEYSLRQKLASVGVGRGRGMAGVASDQSEPQVTPFARGRGMPLQQLQQQQLQLQEEKLLQRQQWLKQEELQLQQQQLQLQKLKLEQQQQEQQLKQQQQNFLPPDYFSQPGGMDQTLASSPFASQLGALSGRAPNLASMPATMTMLGLQQPVASQGSLGTSSSQLPKGRGRGLGRQPQDNPVLRPPSSFSQAQGLQAAGDSTMESVSHWLTTQTIEDKDTQWSQMFAHMSADQKEKHRRKLEKKLKQIASLENRVSQGAQLGPEQEKKLQSKGNVVRELEILSSYLS